MFRLDTLVILRAKVKRGAKMLAIYSNVLFHLPSGTSHGLLVMFADLTAHICMLLTLFYISRVYHDSKL